MATVTQASDKTPQADPELAFGAALYEAGIATGRIRERQELTAGRLLSLLASRMVSVFRLSPVR